MQRAQRAYDAQLPSDGEMPDGPACDEIDEETGEPCGAQMIVTKFRQTRYALTWEAKCPKCGSMCFHEDIDESINDD